MVPALWGAHAVQLASHTGATVIATATSDDEAYLNSTMNSMTDSVDSG